MSSTRCKSILAPEYTQVPISRRVWLCEVWLRSLGLAMNTTLVRVRKNGKYSEEQLLLLRTLIVEEKCTVAMLNQLAGVSSGSVHGICKQLEVSMHNSRGTSSSGGKTACLRRARQTAGLRKKYVNTLAVLFPK